MRGGTAIKDNYKILVATILVVAVIDQATKGLIVASMPLNSGFEVIAGFFDIVHFRNTGAAFSLFSEGGAMKSVFLVLTSVAALVIIAFLIKDEKRRLSVIAFSLIAGGAAGNLIDRVRLGYVVDFLFFSIAGYHWPAFNVADSAITVGAALAAYAYLKKA